MNWTSNGPLLMFLANLLFGLVPIMVRTASREHIDSTEITFFRFLVSCAGVMAIWTMGWGHLRAKNWKGLFWRGFFGAISVLLYFYAVQETGAAKGALLNYTHAIWANLYAVLIFRHKTPKGFWPLMGLAFLGVWLVLNPHFTSINRGDLAGILSGACSGGAVLSVKHLRKTDNALTILASLSFAGLIASLLIGFFPGSAAHSWTPNWTIPNSVGWIALILMATFAMGGQLLFTHAYAYTSIPLGTLMALSVPAIAALGSRVYLNEPLTPHFLLGGAMILTACGVLGIIEGRDRLDDPE